MIKWGTSHVVVTNNDPADFHHLKGAFDIIVVDAPPVREKACSEKDPGAIQEWNESNLQLCSERQQRILADIWPCLKPGGFLVYSTCTYNPGENEAILERLIRKYGARSIEIAPLFLRNCPGKLNRSLLSFLPSPDSGRRIFYRSGTKKRRRRIQSRESQEKYETYPPPSPRRHPGLYPTPRILPPLCQRQYHRRNPGATQRIYTTTEANLHILYQGCEIAEIINRKSKPLPSLALWQGLNKANCASWIPTG